MTATAKMPLPQPAKGLDQVATEVWSVFSPLAQKHNAVNLGQGFPSFGPPEFLRKALVESIPNDLSNQYAHARGHPPLRQELATFSSKYFDRTLNPDKNIVLGVGASEILFAAFRAFLNPDDEVLLFEPYFDQYLPNITLNYGKPKFINMEPPAFEVREEDIEAAVTSNTKIILVTTPHNPTGKVYTKKELETIAKVAERHNLLIINDEVYDHLTYNGRPHVRISTLTGMWERTINVGSFGKLFSCTGWRLGWAIGPERLITPILTVRTRISFSCNRPEQEALTVGMKMINAGQTNYISEMRSDFQRRRDILLNGLKDLGLEFSEPQGGYFVMVNMQEIKVPKLTAEKVPDGDTRKILEAKRDWWICYWLTTEIGVAAIPLSAFYSQPGGTDWIRLCFCKHDEILHEAVKRLQRLKEFK